MSTNDPNDPWTSALFYQMCAWHRGRTRLNPAKPVADWMPGTEPTALKRAMRRHWPRDPSYRVRRFVIRGGVPCET